MRRNKSYLLLISILILANSACNQSLSQVEPTAYPTPIQLPTAVLTIGSSQGNIPLTEAQVSRITAEDAKAAFDSGEAVIVDVRSAEAYASGHAEGAINILLGVFESDIAKVPLEKDQWIITYCT